MMVNVEETYEILDDVELPPAKGRAPRPKKSDPDPIQTEERASLQTTGDSKGFDELFSTPSLMNGEDHHLYGELYRRVEEVVRPKDVFDQMMVADIANHFWEQQRHRRCTGTVINSKRRATLVRMLHGAIGLNEVDAETATDTYFGVARLEEREVADYFTQVRIPKTRAGVVDLMEKHGFVETDIDRLAIETSVNALADLNNLALKHEIQRKVILRELERRRKKKQRGIP
jgi:hypothetical protein